METTTLAIQGMSCAHCVAQVRKALGALPGAELLSVEVGSAQVRHDPATLPSASLVEAVQKAGYAAKTALPLRATLSQVSCSCCASK